MAEGPVRRIGRHIPACATVGMRDLPDGGPPGCELDAGLAALCEPDGRVSRAAALILADQALAWGVQRALGGWRLMMTLDLRLDWHGTLPVARRLTFACEDASIDGAVAFVRGRLLADGAPAATGTGRFFVGAMPGGGTAEQPSDPVEIGPSTKPDVRALLGMRPDGDGWTIAPDPALVGARALPAYHGGYVAALLEAGASRLAGGLAAVDIDVRYLKPALADRPIHLKARAVRPGRLASVVEAELVQGPDGARVAVARALFSGVDTAPVASSRVGWRPLS